MAATMWRAAKGEGVGNVFLEQVPVPEPGPEEVLTRTRVSLVSRGSELWAALRDGGAGEAGRHGVLHHRGRRGGR